MVTLVINGRKVQVEQGATVLQAAQTAGVDIPHLCYHPAFPPEGTCRLCAVEIEGLPKLEPACATAVREGMVVLTESERVVDARRSVLELLLAEHPMDCPVCDKAGVCKLQDYYQTYSQAPARYTEDKLRREKKIPLGKTLLLDRERCVLCTRCVRFLEQVTRTSELGVVERGVHSEISTFEGRPVDNNYSGCLAEICPVGAITDIDFRFKTRAWFLEEGETLCPLCSRGCSVALEKHPGFPRVPGTAKVLRVRARRNDAVNGHWICDLGRYGYGYLERNRCRDISGPAGKNHKLRTMKDVAAWLAQELKALSLRGGRERVAVVASDWLTNEELFLAGSVFKRDLKFSRMHIIGPPEGAGDGFLLTAERSPNRSGAKALGYGLEEPRLEELVRETDMLLVFGPFLGEKHSVSEIREALARVKTKVALTPRLGGWEDAFDLVVPTVWPAEKEGTFTNSQGLAQHFSAAVEPPSSAWEEWRLLIEMGKCDKRNAAFYDSFRSLADVRRAMS